MNLHHDFEGLYLIFPISLTSIGFAFGPIFWGPFSEVWGRRWSMLPPMTCLGIFSIGTALSRNAPAIFITRFFAGLFGSAPVSNVNAALGDIYTREARGVAVAVYSIFIVFGTDLGPVVGSATMLNSHMSWRWTAYMTAFVSFAVVAMVTLGMPETYPPVLLKRKAQRLRKETGDDRYYHPHERIQVDVKSIITKQLSRPLKMLLTEPMVTCIAFYASFVYAILFITIQAFPIVFQELRGWNPITASMSFMAMFIGCVCALVVNIGNQPRYIRISRAANGRPVPEARLAPLAIGAVCMVIGLFWFGWNAEPKYHWVLPCIAIMFIGAGFNIIFQQCMSLPRLPLFVSIHILTSMSTGLNYLVDVYGLYGASAVAANTFLRSVMAAGLPLGVRPMIENLGPGPAMSILGAIAALMLPVPFFLMKYGLALRKRSTFAPVLD